MDININQELLVALQENKIIKSTLEFDQRDEAILALTKTLMTLGYNKEDILDLIDNKMSLLDILLFHYDLLQNKQYECCCLSNKIKKMIDEIKEENNGIYN
ncbi:hypothetical protein [uncultured Thomasclavelia sp.]|uniref:hypothetical protein n=1 Tax=uncultured Thomasclavelia sp. TaxID=3025759 RepID=UPI0025FD4012|nr:hypothetical protein [uncultured Thomasclavelia sp.]